MIIEIIDSRFIQYITCVCDVLKCTPQVLIGGSLKLHGANFRVMSHALFMSCRIRNIERNLNFKEDGD